MVALSEVSVDIVAADDASRFRAFPSEHHFLDDAPTISETVRYVPHHHGRWVALLVFSASVLKSGAIDEKRRGRIAGNSIAVDMKPCSSCCGGKWRRMPAHDQPLPPGGAEHVWKEHAIGPPNRYEQGSGVGIDQRRRADRN